MATKKSRQPGLDRHGLHPIPSRLEIERDVYDLIHATDKVAALEGWMTRVLDNLAVLDRTPDHAVDPSTIEDWRGTLAMIADHLVYWRAMERFAPSDWMRGKRKSRNYKVILEPDHLLGLVPKRSWLED